MPQNLTNKGTKKINSSRKTLAVLTIGILLGTTLTFFKEVHGEEKLSENQLKQCEYLYFNYKKFGEKEFVYRYSFKSFIQECVNLYKDPDWTFAEKEKIDKYFAKQEAAKAAEQTKKSEVTVLITKKYRIGDIRYVISFDACTENSRTQAIFLIYSDIDKFIGTSQRLIPQDSCSTYWTNVNAKLPNSIGIQYVEDLKEHAYLLKKPLNN